MPTATEIAATIAAGRAEMATMFTDTCRITEPGVGPKVFNESTGQYTDPPRIVSYEGPCRIQVKVDVNSNVVETTAGEREWTYLTGQLQLPVESTEDVEVDSVCEILTAPYDASLVGALFNIQGTYHKSHAVYRRFRVREVVS